MGNLRWLTRHQIRHRAVTLAALALVAALGTAATLVAADASHRTADAYGAYLHRAAVGDVVINPSAVSSQIDHAVRTLPGVKSVTSDALLEAGIDRHPRPRTQAELDGDPSPVLVRGSIDGRYLTMDRPALTKGRLPAGNNEALVTAELAKAQHIALGDVLPMSFWSRRTEILGVKTAVPPIGIEHVTVVGIGTLSDEVLPDGLYPRETIIVSPDIARRYDCIPTAPGHDASLEQAMLALAPQRCATDYRYYSIALRNGARGTTGVLAAFATAAARLTKQLPQGLLDQHVAYTLVAKNATADERRRVDRSTQPIVIALAVLAAAAAAILLLVLGLAVARILVRSGDDQLTWWRLGLTRGQRWFVLAVPLFLAVGGGLLLGALIACVASPLAPLGNVRSIDPAPARQFSGLTALIVVGLVLALLLCVALPAWRAAGRVGTRARDHLPATASRRFGGSNRPAVDEGLRAAYQTNRGAGLVLASGATAVAVFVTAVVFGASLSTLLSKPASYGWPWDVATVDNFGYGGINLQAASKSLAQRSDVQKWTALGFSNSATIDGDAVPTVFSFDRSSTTAGIAVVSGRLPKARDEVAVGARTAADEHVGVGDTVKVAGYEITPRHATVTGIVVLPALGPFRADRAAPGIGVVAPQAMLDPQQLPMLVSFVGVELRPHTDRAAAVTSLHRAFASWDPSALATFDFSRPVRPPEIIDARSMRNSPMFVGGLLVVGATIGLAVGVALSVRGRRRDLAVLRALGFTRGQLRSSVFVQTFTSVAGAIVVGIPIGLLIGRFAWRAFASRLGVLVHPTIPVAWLVATAVGAMVVALVASVWPAMSAARTRPADALRTD